MDDLISRQALLDAVESADWYHINKSGDMVHGAASEDGAWYKAKDVYQAIDSVPSARPTGKWIRDRYCSNCEWSKEDADYTSNWSDNFCPNCGTDMRGENHG